MGGVPGAKATRVTTVTSLLASDLLGAAGRGEGLRGRDLGGAGGQGGKGDGGWVPGAFGVILPRAPETRATAGHRCRRPFGLRDGKRDGLPVRLRGLRGMRLR